MMVDPVKIELQPLGRTIEVERGTPLRNVLHDFGVEFPCGGRARCTGCRIKRLSGSLAVSDEQAEMLTDTEIADGWRLACRCTVEEDVTLQVGQWQTVVLADHSSFAFTPRLGMGIAVDLGTTTVVAQLLDLTSGRVLAVQTGLNPNAIHGNDVMSRLQAARKPGARTELTEGLRAGIETLVRNLLAARSAAGNRLDTVVIAGNTAMHHLFCGIDVEPLAHAPFVTTAPGPRRFRSRELGWKLERDPIVRFLPCLGSFVGSDTLCSIIATNMQRSETPFVLIDLGTNGEIVIGNRERMLCASTAAGPAFEGGGIKMGMRAITGAISEVSAQAGRLCCRVIGDASPRGICGSGLVDAVAAGLDLGLIQPSGRLAHHGRPLELAPPVTLTQTDIRQLQLAKAAIAAGVRILRRRFGEKAGAPMPFYLAGAFGNYIDRASARRIGLLNAPIDLIHPAGNTALLGAKIALFQNDEQDDDHQEIRDRIEHVSLAADPEFEQTFVDETVFPE